MAKKIDIEMDYLLGDEEASRKLIHFLIYPEEYNSNEIEIECDKVNFRVRTFNGGQDAN